MSGVHEWTWNIPLAGRLCGELEARGHDADLLFRPDTSRGAMSELVRRINDGEYDAVISLHFNAGGGGAGGHLQLHHPASARGQSLAEACQAAHVRAYPGIRDRGLWATTVNGAGVSLWMLTRTRPPAVIVESHFGDSEDHEYATARRDDLAVELAISLDQLAQRAESGRQW